MTTLQGKAALVTGGSRGIGAAIASRLARDGADVAITYVAAREKADAVVSEIQSHGGRAIAIQADSADAQAAARSVEQAADAFGRLDILIANAGVAEFHTIGAEGGLAVFDRTFAINVRGVFAAAEAAVARIADGGRIIVIGSVSGERSAFPGNAIYGASKAAVAGLVRGWARDLGPRGITVNVVQPGPVDTDMNPKEGAFADSIRSYLAIPQYAEGADIAGLVSWLAGPEARYVTGAGLPLDGGFLA